MLVGAGPGVVGPPIVDLREQRLDPRRVRDALIELECDLGRYSKPKSATDAGPQMARDAAKSVEGRGSLGIALACVLLSFMMMITRAKAVPQVIGFLSMENGLFFAATSATTGMPMVVELGIALDVLIGVLILGVFMFQIRERFDSLDIPHLEEPGDE